MSKKEYHKKWCLENEAHLKEYKKLYYEKNKQACIERARKRYLLNKDSIKAYSKKHYQSNKQRHAENAKSWKQRNIAKYKKIHADVQLRRRARIASVNNDNYKRIDVYNRFGGYCIVCDDRINLDIKFPDKSSFTIHHLIPISKGGDNTTKNVAPAHLICNIRVGVKIPIAIKPRVYNV